VGKEPRIDTVDNTSRAGWVAVVGQLRRDHSRFPLLYVEAVQAAGGTPKVVSTFGLLPEEDVPDGVEVTGDVDPKDVSVLEGAAGLVLPGGGDIDPAWYGQPRHSKTTRINHRRDRFELSLLEAALQGDLPVLAICHGMQLLNVHYGGTLVQHLADNPRFVDHDTGLPASEPVHQLNVKTSSVLSDALGTTCTETNSHHHQGVDRLAPQLEDVAWAEDGVLEAVVGREHSWVVGVQWHPEAMARTQADQKSLFDSFVAAVDDYAARKLAPPLHPRSRRG
jgi:putative glutamine amidotransferase